MAFSIYDKEKKLNFVLPNLSGTALFQEIAIFGVWYYVCVSTHATETKTKFWAHCFFVSVNAGQKTVYAAANSIASSDIEELLD